MANTGFYQEAKRDLLRVGSIVVYQIVLFLSIVMGAGFLNKVASSAVDGMQRILLEMYLCLAELSCFLVFRFDKVLCYAHHFILPSIPHHHHHLLPTPPTPPSQTIHGSKIHNRISPAHAQFQIYSSSKYFQSRGVFFNVVLR